MATRQTGFALLASDSVQTAQDNALIANVATLESRVPFLHFFDGFRTSSEVAKIEQISMDDIRAMVDENKIYEIRERALNPERPFIRGTSQNPDAYFQGREAGNKYYEAVPAIVQKAMRNGLAQQKAAVQSGVWPLYRYNPANLMEGKNPLTLDSKDPTISVKDYAYNENRYRQLVKADEERAEELMKEAEENVKVRWDLYKQMAEVTYPKPDAD